MGWRGAPDDLDHARPPTNAAEARRELVRRHLHTVGPTTPESFAEWAGVAARHARTTFDELRDELTDVRTPMGEAVILNDDEEVFRSPDSTPAPARLLPSGDPYLLLWGADRELLVANGAHRDELWPSWVWPGAVMVDGDLVGTWRRSAAVVTISTWRRLPRAARHAVEAEVCSFPLPDIDDEPSVRWTPPTSGR